mmetsp:Transcript_35279/g.69623  ORF Transcript_35279/g.69623 Transcript_35279/m.69623 type:complete len:85 (-) Transcript_35279:365-619(-)
MGEAKLMFEGLQGSLHLFEDRAENEYMKEGVNSHRPHSLAQRKCPFSFYLALFVNLFRLNLFLWPFACSICTPLTPSLTHSLTH